MSESFSHEDVPINSGIFEHPFSHNFDMDENLMGSLSHNVDDYSSGFTGMEAPSHNVDDYSSGFAGMEEQTNIEDNSSLRGLGISALSVNSLIRSANDAVQVINSLDGSIKGLSRSLRGSHDIGRGIESLKASVALLNTLTDGLSQRLDAFVDLAEQFESKINQCLDNIEALEGLLGCVVKLEQTAMDRIESLALRGKGKGAMEVFDIKRSPRDSPTPSIP